MRSLGRNSWRRPIHAFGRNSSPLLWQCVDKTLGFCRLPCYNRTMPCITLDNVCFQYKTDDVPLVALDHASLSIDEGQTAQRSSRAHLGQGHRLWRRHGRRGGRSHLPRAFHRGHGLPKPRQPNGGLHHRGRHRLWPRKLGHPPRGDDRARPMGSRGGGYVGVPHPHPRQTVGRPKTARRHSGHPRHASQGSRVGREYGHARPPRSQRGAVRPARPQPPRLDGHSHHPPHGRMYRRRPRRCPSRGQSGL